MKKNVTELTEDEKIEQAIFEDFLSRITLVEAHRIVEEVLGQNAKEAVKKLTLEQREAALKYFDNVISFPEEGEEDKTN